MSRSAWLMISIFVGLASFQALAQDTCSTDTADYELSAANGTPSRTPATKNFNYTRPNKSSVTIRLKDINPYHYKCGVSTTTTDVKEPDISGFTSLIGGVAASPGSNLPAPASLTAPAASGTTTTEASRGFKGATKKAKGAKKRAKSAQKAAEDCYKLYDPTHKNVLYLRNVAELIDGALQHTTEGQATTIQALKTALPALRAQSACSNTVGQARTIIGITPFAIQSVAISESLAAPPPLPNLHTMPEGTLDLDKAIDAISLRAQLLAQHLTDQLNNDCRKEYAKNVDDDRAFLTAVTTGTATNPAAVSKWREQLAALTTVRNNVIVAQSTVKAVLDSPENFTITRTIDGDQQVVTYTAKCDVVPEITVAAPTSTGSVAQAQPSPTPSPSPSPTAFTHDFKFGLGPRFAFAGGVVVAPLQQITFSTTANPAASASGSTAPANIITESQDSGTRILPIAMLHGRFWDNLPDCGKDENGVYRQSCFESRVRAWLPSYLSAGVTAKSTDNNGTNIEYLLGPSWALVQRQLFFTVGAYGGHQQRLAPAGSNTLKVGDATSLSAANLPLINPLIWKVGFAISWAPAGK